MYAANMFEIRTFECAHADGDAAAGIFNQIDPLSMPGAGLRHLDFPHDVQSMFEDLFVPVDGAHSNGHIEPSPAAVPKQSMVRVYGSEQDM